MRDLYCPHIYNPELDVLTELAHANYEMIMSDTYTRKNFLRFVYSFLKQKAKTLQEDVLRIKAEYEDYADREEYQEEFEDFHNCLHYYMFQYYFEYRECTSFADIVCECHPDDYTPSSYYFPIVFKFDATKEY